MIGSAIVTVGLQFGDEAKGATVDWLCRSRGVDLVVRYCGGCQASHAVVLPDGRSHAFAQFGAGTLAGVPTYLGPRVVVDPLAMRREAAHLIELGVAAPYSTLTVHPDCPVATPYHRAINRATEWARGGLRHGSCGMGVGEARRDWLEHGPAAVRFGDVVAARRRGDLASGLELCRQRTLLSLSTLLPSLPPDQVAGIMRLMGPSAALAGRLAEAARGIRVAVAPPDAGLAVFEGAQGVLLDEWFGFHPYTTWGTVTDRHALDLAAEAGVRELCTLGLVRAHVARHGPGPLPTWDHLLTSRLRDPHNPTNAWQGGLRLGHPDLPLLRYAAACCPVDGLAVSWLDGFDGGPACLEYEGIPAPTPPPGPDLARQEALGRSLVGDVVRYTQVSRGDLLDALGSVAPVLVTADGPTYLDRRGVELPSRPIPEPGAPSWPKPSRSPSPAPSPG